MQWGVVVVVGLFGIYAYQRDTNAANTVNVNDLQRRIDGMEATVKSNRADIDRQTADMKREMLTKEVFEAYHATDQQRFERMEKMLEQLLIQGPR